MPQLDLSYAEKIRNQLSEEQRKEIERMYRKISRSIGKEAKRLPKSASGVLRGVYLSQLKRQLNDQLGQLGRDLESLTQNNMGSMVDSVIEANLRFLAYINMPIEGAFSHVSRDVIESIITGRVYQGDWSLSKAIWKHTQRTQRDINRIIAEGVAQNKSAYDIAKDLERYVNPTSRKPWNWGKVYPGTARRIDYNAQRLARTLVSHAYQQAFIRTTQRNPFVTKYKWDASNSSRVCDLCASRDGNYYDKDDLPMDHPNGMCTYIAVMEDSMVDIADRVADWVLGAPDPELDRYADYLRNS